MPAPTATGLVRLSQPGHEADGDGVAAGVALGDADPWLLGVAVGLGVLDGDALSGGATDVWLGCGGAYVS